MGKSKGNGFSRFAQGKRGEGYSPRGGEEDWSDAGFLRRASPRLADRPNSAPPIVPRISSHAGGGWPLKTENNKATTAPEIAPNPTIAQRFQPVNRPYVLS